MRYEVSKVSMTKREDFIEVLFSHRLCNDADVELVFLQNLHHRTTHLVVVSLKIGS